MISTEVRLVQHAGIPGTDMWTPNTALDENARLLAWQRGQRWREEGFVPERAFSSFCVGCENTLEVALGSAGLDHVLHVSTHELDAPQPSNNVTPAEQLLASARATVDYLSLLRGGDHIPGSVAVVADDLVVRGLLSYVELGGLVRDRGNISPEELAGLAQGRDDIYPGSEAKLIIGGILPEVRIEIEYASMPEW